MLRINCHGYWFCYDVTDSQFAITANAMPQFCNIRFFLQSYLPLRCICIPIPYSVLPSSGADHPRVSTTCSSLCPSHAAIIGLSPLTTSPLRRFSIYVSACRHFFAPWRRLAIRGGRPSRSTIPGVTSLRPHKPTNEHPSAAQRVDTQTPGKYIPSYPLPSAIGLAIRPIYCPCLRPLALLASTQATDRD